MAAIRAVILYMVFACGDAVWKRNVKSVIEGEFPDLKNLSGSLGDAVKKVADSAKQIQDGAKDLALGAVEAAAAQVNQSLEVVGREVLEMNSTAWNEIQSLDEKVKKSRDRAAVFAEGTQKALEKIDPVFQQLVAQLSSVRQVAKQVLSTLGQEKAMEKIDSAMDMAVTTASSWSSAAQKLLGRLHNATARLAGRNKTTVLLSVFPAEEVSEMLRQPMAELRAAAGKLKDVAEDTTEAMGNFVDAATEAAKGRVPEALLGNATSILQGVHAKAAEELAPFGDVAQGIVGGLYAAGGDAGLDFSWAAQPLLPFFLLLLPWGW